jgi:uncharacterized membrane protein (DUF373 family)
LSRFSANRVLDVFQQGIVAVLITLLGVIVAAATAHLAILMFTRFSQAWGEVSTAEGLIPVMQRAFGGVLIVVLGLELMETLRTFSSAHKVRVEVILIVGIIAVGRHIIEIDPVAATGTQLAGMGALILSLTIGYFLVLKGHAPPSKPSQED